MKFFVREFQIVYWVLGLSLIYVAVVSGMGARLAQVSWFAFAGRYLVGLLAGALGVTLVAYVIWAVVDPPRMSEFDILVFPFFVAPVGGFLGALTAGALFVNLRRDDQLGRFLWMGGVPLALLTLWNLYDTIRLRHQYLTTVRDNLFWGFAAGFPLLWLLFLAGWHWQTRRTVSRNTGRFPTGAN